jgi:hypothetical protein
LKIETLHSNYNLKPLTIGCRSRLTTRNSQLKESDKLQNFQQGVFSLEAPHNDRTQSTTNAQSEKDVKFIKGALWQTFYDRVKKSTLKQDPHLEDPNRRSLMEAIERYPQPREMTPVVSEMYTRYKERQEQRKQSSSNQGLPAMRSSQRESTQRMNLLTPPSNSNDVQSNPGITEIHSISEEGDGIVNITLAPQNEGDYEQSQY